MFSGRLYGFLRPLACAAACLSALLAQAQESAAAALRQEHAQLAQPLARSEFGRPLLIDSRHGPNQAEGVVHAVLDAPLERVAALGQPQRWCEVLILHQNTRSCQVEGASEVRLAFASKTGLMRDGAGLVLQLASDMDGQMLSVRLSAARGPMGTRDYDIRMQAIALDAQHSYVRFRYSYGFGLAARMAMQAYLGTWGQQKVGFSREEAPASQPGPLVRGMRGVIERNTMRYFLAMDTVLQTLDLAPAEQDRRLQMWFDATERYARQLHELDRQEYLALKRQQLGLP